MDLHNQERALLRVAGQHMMPTLLKQQGTGEQRREYRRQLKPTTWKQQMDPHVRSLRHDIFSSLTK